MKKDLKYYKENAEEDYLTTPISVLRYIGELERKFRIVMFFIFLLFLIVFGGILIGLNI